MSARSDLVDLIAEELERAGTRSKSRQYAERVVRALTQPDTEYLLCHREVYTVLEAQRTGSVHESYTVYVEEDTE